jgi:hypothetical protein
VSQLFHTFNSTPIGQRSDDGYVNATAMCQANSKLFADYQRLETTKAFLEALSGSMGIPIDLLIRKITTGANENRGTWIHPYVAINLGQWCSPQFAVFVSKLVFSWTTGDLPSSPIQKSDRIQELELEVRLAELKLESLKLTVSQPPASPSVEPQRQGVQKRSWAKQKPGQEFIQTVLTLVGSKELTAEEVAQLTGVSQSYTRRTLAYLHRRKLVLRKRHANQGAYIYFSSQS